MVRGAVHRGSQGTATIPWDRGAPSARLVEWAEGNAVSGDGRTALVVGCGPGRDSEYLAGLGFRTTAFDISPTAVAMARERHPDSPVAPGGRLLVVALGPGRDDAPTPDGPPREEVDALGSGLEAEQVELIPDDTDPAVSRWQAQFRRS